MICYLYHTENQIFAFVNWHLNVYFTSKMQPWGFNDKKKDIWNLVSRVSKLQIMTLFRKHKSNQGTVLVWVSWGA